MSCSRTSLCRPFVAAEGFALRHPDVESIRHLSKEGTCIHFFVVVSKTKCYYVVFLMLA